METTPCVKKWDDPTASMGGKTISYRDIVVLHASETYLTAAEAYYMAGNETAALEKSTQCATAPEHLILTALLTMK